MKYNIHILKFTQIEISEFLNFVFFKQITTQIQTVLSVTQKCCISESETNTSIKEKNPRSVLSNSI